MRRIQNMLTGLMAVGLSLGLAGGVHAALIDRGLFDDGFGGSVNLIYDSTQDITWLGDANFGAGSAFDDGISATDGHMSWASAMAWAASLTVGGFTDWRLPTTLEPDPSCSNFPAASFGCTGSEMGHLANADGVTTASPGPFINVQPGLGGFYWSGTDNFIAPATLTWGVRFSDGVQVGIGKTSQTVHAWGARDGDVLASAPIPEPSTMLLFGTGVLGLIGYARRRGKGFNHV